MYKRKPVGDYHVGVCTNTLCAVMGGDAIFERLKEHLDVGNDETTADGKVTLEHVECNAACDYAPVMMVNWEFMDNMTPSSAIQLVDDLRDGQGGHLHPRPADLHLARGRAGARRLPGRPRRRGPRRRRGRPGRTRDRPRARLDGSGDRRTPRSQERERGRCRAMTDVLTPVLTDIWDAERAWTLTTYEEHGGYAALEEGARHGAGRDRRGGQGLRPARPRRRRLPDRHEVVASSRRTTPSRSTSSSTPTSPSRAPARTSR